jgi:hypothetical protein
MRVWLVADEQQREGGPPLEAVLRQLAERAPGRLSLLGCGPLRPGLAAELRGWQLDLLVVHEPSWSDSALAQELLDMDVGVLVIAEADRCERFVGLAERYPVVVAPPAGRPEDVWPALVSTVAARRRHLQALQQLAEVEQRLADRIVIERAKGILVLRLGITEDEAYRRLRVISRRQRRQMRDIAQSLLDTESLLLPEMNGFLDPSESESRNSPPA